MIEIGSALIAAVCGVAAAYFWLKSSNVPVSPTYATVGLPEPADEGQWQQNQWIAGLVGANQNIGKLNGHAARLTAASVFFSALSTVDSSISVVIIVSMSTAPL